MSTIQDAIKQMIELEGLDIFKEPRKFFAYLDDLSPEYPRERRIIKNNFDDKLLGLFIDDTKKVGHRLRLIREELEYLGYADDKICFIIESFGIPLGWEQEILDLKSDSPTQVPTFNKQSQEPVNDSATDVALNDDFLKLLGFMDKDLIPPVLNIPPTYCPPLSGITYRVTKIEDEVFKGCDKLQSVIIPDTVTEIGKSAFENCKSLEKINISETVTKIGDRAFFGCELLKDVILTNSITDIGKGAFLCCSSLISIHIPNKIIRISEGLFGKCKSLVNISIPNGVTEIEDLAFAGCESLSSVLISKTVTKIGIRAFANCKNLESILIPNSVVDVGSEAFGGCEKLQQFTLPTRFTVFKDDINKQIDLTIEMSKLGSKLDEEIFRKEEDLRGKLRKHGILKQNYLDSETAYEKAVDEYNRFVDAWDKRNRFGKPKNLEEEYRLRQRGRYLKQKCKEAAEQCLKDIKLFNDYDQTFNKIQDEIELLKQKKSEIDGTPYNPISNKIKIDNEEIQKELNETVEKLDNDIKALDGELEGLEKEI